MERDKGGGGARENRGGRGTLFTAVNRKITSVVVVPRTYH